MCMCVLCLCVCVCASVHLYFCLPGCLRAPARACVRVIFDKPLILPTRSLCLPLPFLAFLSLSSPPRFSLAFK
jgi:hypothetical protein